MKKPIFALPFLTIVLIFWTIYSAQSEVPDVDKPLVLLAQTTLQDRYKLLRERYIQLNKEGYDLSEIDELRRELNLARQNRDRTRAEELLNEIETALDRLENGRASEAQETKSDNLSVEIIPQYFDKKDVSGFALGVEYLPLLDVADIFGQTGIEWAKSAGIEWNMLEPKPPGSNGEHSYRWETLDNLINRWQSAGVKNLQLWIKCTAEWATEKVKMRKGASLTRRVSAPPRDGYWDDYAEFIKSIVERYDKDGRDDAPGLLYPVIYYQIESEVQHRGQWQGTPEKYLQLLETAYQAAKEANPKTTIILASFAFQGIVDDMPDRETLEKRIKDKSYLQDMLAKNKIILSRPDIYDQAAFNYLTDYKSAYGIVAWIRHQMREYGYEKPIWASDAFSGLLIYKNEDVSLFRDEDTRMKIFKALQNENRGGDPEITRWFRANQSIAMTRKILVAMETGIVGINVGNTRDWTEAWKLDSHYQKSTAPMGLVDLTINGRKIRSWKGRPAYYTLKCLVEKLNDAESITRLKAPGGVYAYRIDRAREPIFAMWYDDNKIHPPGKSTSRMPVRIRADNEDAIVSSIITDEGRELLEGKKPSYIKGVITFDLDETPLFIEGPKEIEILFDPKME